MIEEYKSINPSERSRNNQPIIRKVTAIVKRARVLEFY